MVGYRFGLFGENNADLLAGYKVLEQKYQDGDGRSRFEWDVTMRGPVVGLTVNAIDEGNRTERVTLGLGAGRSDVRVRAQVFEVTLADGSRLADEIEVDAKSGPQPGMAETMGAGALAGHLVTATLVSSGLQVADEELGASVVADADRVSKGITKQLASFFAQQRWTQ